MLYTLSHIEHQPLTILVKDDSTGQRLVFSTTGYLPEDNQHTIDTLRQIVFAADLINDSEFTDRDRKQFLALLGNCYYAMQAYHIKAIDDISILNPARQAIVDWVCKRNFVIGTVKSLYHQRMCNKELNQNVIIDGINMPERHILWSLFRWSALMFPLNSLGYEFFHYDPMKGEMPTLPVGVSYSTLPMDTFASGIIRKQLPSAVYILDSMITHALEKDVKDEHGDVHKANRWWIIHRVIDYHMAVVPKEVLSDADIINYLHECIVTEIKDVIEHNGNML